jgi:hypothetical protein
LLKQQNRNSDRGDVEADIVRLGVEDAMEDLEDVAVTVVDIAVDSEAEMIAISPEIDIMMKTSAITAKPKAIPKKTATKANGRLSKGEGIKAQFGQIIHVTEFTVTLTIIIIRYRSALFLSTSASGCSCLCCPPILSLFRHRVARFPLNLHHLLRIIVFKTPYALAIPPRLHELIA